MIYLIICTLLWAFSFSLIGEFLAGTVDPYFSVWVRVALALSLFLPFLRKKQASWETVISYTAIGAIQLGLMYVFYYNSFRFLSVPEVLVFTILTPIYITLIDDAFEKQWNPSSLLAAAIAVAGTGVIRANPIESEFLQGFLVVQGANACFAFGQVAYKRLRAKGKSPFNAFNAFAWFFFGAFLVSTLTCILFGKAKYPSDWEQWAVLIWLGFGASGLGYFLWNHGATKVNAGVLAVMNNALIPAGLIVNLVIWNRDADLIRIFIGSAIMGFALWLGIKGKRSDLEHA